MELDIFNPDSLKIGDIILFDLFADQNNQMKLIASNGDIFDDNLELKLKNLEPIFIKKADNFELTKSTLKLHIRQNKDSTLNSLELLYMVSSKFYEKFYNSSDDKIDMECVNSIVSSILLLLRYNDKFSNEAMNYFVKEHTLSTHSLQVCIYSLRLGMLLKLDENDLILLGIASFLHDIGYKKLPFDPIEKDNKLNDEEFSIMKKHTLYGVEILEKNNIKNPLILNGIKNHHERCNGSGYPNGLKNNKIDSLSSIIAICDTFEALTNSRKHYKQRYKTFQALKLMLESSEFNVAYLKTAIASLK